MMGHAKLQLYVCFTTCVKPLEDLQALLADHLEWIAGLEKSGSLFAAGPFRDLHETAGPPSGDGMIILRATSAAEAEEIARGCPFHMVGVRMFEIRPWVFNEGHFNLTISATSGGVKIS
ncbi:unnamed protein product [Phaeothamnion confervicola]